MATVAILGFGTVGGGVLEVLRQNADGVRRRLGEDVRVGYICDVRDFSWHPDAGLFVRGIEPVLADASVSVVVETIGGADVALDYVRRALASGRHVVTSNKELVSLHGAELLALAREKGAAFLFEASVGGGTPVITPMHQCLAANRIRSVCGIVNGTTNFMLTRMEQDGLSFEAALAEAQALGYAETIDPSFDVDGIDAGRKIAILASLAFGSHVYPQNIHTRGIRGVTPADMAAAARLGSAVKLVAYASKDGGSPPIIGVEPMLVPKSSPLAGVEDVFNAVTLNGDMLGDVTFRGRGAGRLPTASAVAADIIDALKFGVKNNDSLFWRPAPPAAEAYDACACRGAYLRAADERGAERLRRLDGAQPIEDAGAVLLPAVSGPALRQLCQNLAQEGCEPAILLKMWR